jgi:hypothetical protein
MSRSDNEKMHFQYMFEFEEALTGINARREALRQRGAVRSRGIK